MLKRRHKDDVKHYRDSFACATQWPFGDMEEEITQREEGLTIDNEEIDTPCPEAALENEAVPAGDREEALVQPVRPQRTRNPPVYLKDYVIRWARRLKGEE